MSAAQLNGQNKPGLHPQKLALWLGMASIMMLFAGLTSAYIVKKAGGNWEDFRLPDLFTLNTLIILISSGTMHLAVVSFKKNLFTTFRVALGVTLGLGTVFLLGQYFAWEELTNIGMPVDGNPSGSFIYVISGAHGLHILGGVVALLITFLVSLRKNYSPIDQLMLETNPHKHVKLELLATYWHFVDILWLYLFLFFYFNH